MEDDSKKVNFKCFVCGRADFRFFARKKSYDLYKCRGCGLIFVYPLPQNLAEIYAEDYFFGAKQGSGYVDYEKDKQAMDSTFEIYLNEIEMLIPGRGRLLDVGAATGAFLETARSRGWRVSGTEISDYAAARARQKNLNVQTGMLESLHLEKGLFDVVTMWDVLEHLPDPLPTLKLVNGLLKPGGLIALNIPDTGSLFAKLMGKHWHLIVPPEHLFYFNADNLTKLLKKTNFEVSRTTCLGKKFTIQYILKTLVAWQGFSGWRWLAGKVQNKKLGRIAIPINLRDNLFLIARKTQAQVL